MRCVNADGKRQTFFTWSPSHRPAMSKSSLLGDLVFIPHILENVCIRRVATPKLPIVGHFHKVVPGQRALFPTTVSSARPACPTWCYSCSGQSQHVLSATSFVPRGSTETVSFPGGLFKVRSFDNEYRT